MLPDYIDECQQLLNNLNSVRSTRTGENPQKNQRKLIKRTIFQVQKLFYKVGLRDGITPTLYTSPCQFFFWKAKNAKIPEKTVKKCRN